LSYGARWLAALLEGRNEMMHEPGDTDKIREHCPELVAAEIASCTEEDRQEIHAIAEHILARAEKLLA
jgi:hypothetical protein